MNTTFNIDETVNKSIHHATSHKAAKFLLQFQIA